MTAEPDLPTTIPATLARAVERYGSSEALVDESLRLDFAGPRRPVDEAARGLIASGVEPGDRVGIWAPNIAEWVIAALGVHRAGAVVVTLNTRFKGHEAAYILAQVRAPACCSPSPTSSTPTTSRCCATEPSVPDALEEIVVLAGRPDRRHDVVGGLPRPGPTSSTETERGPGARRSRPDDLVRHPVHVGHHRGSRRARCSRHGASVRAYDAWADGRRAAARATAT